MSLSNTNVDTAVDVNTNENEVASFLLSLPTTVSERIRNGDGGDAENNQFRVIMGNEAGDADSIVSALTLGYVTSQKMNASSSAAAAAAAPSTITSTTVVPIVSIPRADMALRRDVTLLLQFAGINTDNLLYVDDDIVTSHLLPSSSSGAAEAAGTKASITLVDHNRITSSLSHLSSMVTEIVDHHEDERVHETVTFDSGKRIIAFDKGHATVASTCTLVAERLFEILSIGEEEDATVATAVTNKIDGSLGLLLLGVILLDSVNMLPAAGKGTPRDETAIRMLLAHTDWTYFEQSSSSSSPSLMDATAHNKIFPHTDEDANTTPTLLPDRTALFDILSGAKNDRQFWMELSVLDCLRMDYKKFLVANTNGGKQQSTTPSSPPLSIQSIGLSSVLIDMDSLLSKDNFMEDMETFLSTRDREDVGLFGILTVDFRDGKPNRELLLTGPNADVVDSFATYLVSHANTAFLEITERSSSATGCAGTVETTTEGKNGTSSSSSTMSSSVRVFRQGNGKGSRKQVAPLLLEHASSLSLSSHL